MPLGKFLNRVGVVDAAVHLWRMGPPRLLALRYGQPELDPTKS
jgi:hypothetical protein